VLTASVGIVEIWDAQNYEQAISDAALDFADLAEEVMGTPNTTANELS
jgi:MraZ protein